MFFIDCSNKLSHWKIVEKLSYEMTLIYENSMWLKKECTESLTVKEFRETGNRIIVMQDRIRQLIVNEKTAEGRFDVSGFSSLS